MNLPRYVSEKCCICHKQKQQYIKSTDNDDQKLRKEQKRSMKSSTFSCSFQESMCDGCWSFAAAAFCG
jgi:hypothetical protein